MNNQYAADPSVWLVDDDLDDQLLILTAFKNYIPSGSLRILNDGDEVLPALNAAHTAPKLILMDINMTRQNGFDTLRQVRQIWAWQHLPIVIFSTSSNRQDYSKALALGATHFFTKPSSYTQLQVLIGQIVHDWQLSTSQNSLTECQ